MGIEANNELASASVRELPYKRDFSLHHFNTLRSVHSCSQLGGTGKMADGEDRKAV
jgi:hypothetical protein